MLILFVLAAASTSPPPIFTAEQQSAIKEAVGRKLNDPFSAQYEWQPVQDDASYCGWVNAKNAFGAYVGYKPFFVLYSIGAKTNKTTVYTVELDTSIVTKMCGDSGYRVTYGH